MKTIVVTGATSGIGLAVVKALVERGDKVIAVGRTEETCKKAYDHVSHEKLDNLTFLPCDLASQKQIRALAETIKSILGDQGIDALINNAAAVPQKRTVTEDNIEMQFAVNHLAAFLLTHLMLPLLTKNEGRVIASGSRSHYKSHLDFDNLMLEKKYFILRAYGRSKLCNTFFTYEFNRRYISEGMIAYALDPGMVISDIARKRSKRFIAWFWDTYTKKGQQPEEVSHHYLELIDNPKHIEPPYYYKYGKFIEPAEYSKREDLAKKLWDVSMAMTKMEKF